MKKSKYQLKAEKEITDPLVSKMIELYKQGMTYRQIEPIIGRSRQWISTRMKTYHPEAFEVGG